MSEEVKVEKVSILEIKRRQREIEDAFDEMNSDKVKLENELIDTGYVADEGNDP